MSPSAIPDLASPKLRRLSPFASNARNAAEMPEKASLRESRRACRGHCTSKRRKPSDIAGVVVVHISWSQVAPVLLPAHLHSSSLVRPDWVGSQFSSVQSSPPSPHFVHVLAPTLEYVPEPQGSHAVCAGFGTLPAAHCCVHMPPAREMYPPSQLTHSMCASFDSLPAAQSQHAWPALEIWPAGQCSQLVPQSFWFFPAGQSVHWYFRSPPLEEMSSAYCPGEHRSHRTPAAWKTAQL